MPLTAGNEIDAVEVEIDYAIISHFSRHLYSSPNKAIEELVSNGFDAFAEKVFVYIPGDYVTDKVIVWDDGTSMDVDQLKRLWWIARSPKDDGAQRIQTVDGKTRAMIGKFGIGKLACYAIGNRVTHLCKRDGRFLSVTVDYDEVPKLDDSTGAPKKYRTPIRELSADEAKATINEAFNGSKEPKAMELFEKNSWTIAFIDSFRPTPVRLTPGRLRWVISNGMPLRPDFEVSLADEQITAKAAGQAAMTWDMSSGEVQAAITSAWNDGIADKSVEGEPEFTTNDEGVAVVRLTALGDVSTTIRLFAESLKVSSEEEVDANRAYGFFVMVRGRLLNPDDPLVFLHPPSFGTFYRSQYIINADGLDEILLADREHLVAEAPECRELSLLQRALYLASRNAIEDLDETREMEQRSESLLPTGSRDQYRAPLTTLLKRDGLSPTGTLLNQPKIERANLSSDQPLAIISEDQSSFQVNSSHPFVKALDATVGTGKKAREILRTLDVLAVSERLLEGYLYDIGLPDAQVSQIVTWRDGLLRTMGIRLRENPEELERAVRDTSFTGGKDFENAIADVFRAMGFVANRDGAPGKKDILAVAPIGRTTYSFSVEAKGCNEALASDDADVANAAAHRDEVGADFAVIVAREFQGFQKGGDEPQIIKDCAAASGDVAIMTVDTLIDLYRVTKKLSLPLDALPEVIRMLEAPTKKVERIGQIADPTTSFDWMSLLDQIWSLQQGSALGDVVPYRSLWQDKWRETFPEIEEFTLRLTALEALATPLMTVDTSKEHVTLLQAPEIIADRISTVAAADVEDSTTDSAGQ
jgi:hypothetical protein